MCLGFKTLSMRLFAFIVTSTLTTFESLSLACFGDLETHIFLLFAMVPHLNDKTVILELP